MPRSPLVPLLLAATRGGTSVPAAAVSIQADAINSVNAPVRFGW
jgi:hypothetical protein